MEQQIQKLELKDTVDTCPVCGYTDGFNVSFQQNGNKIKIILICPDCHARFDPGWEM
ncbi:MAG: hypothetical protein JSV49_10265 [Thermoplasmata archaeon]|nr:MAG: hypothetical protein JSV49_10265 [Thermoplasmata archaeon]